MRELFTQATYLAASVFFILGLRSLAHPDRARAGMNQAAIGMLLAVLGTLFVQEIVTYEWIVAGLAGLGGSGDGGVRWGVGAGGARPPGALPVADGDDD